MCGNNHYYMTHLQSKGKDRGAHVSSTARATLAVPAHDLVTRVQSPLKTKSSRKVPGLEGREVFVTFDDTLRMQSDR